jgi:hypothetical protein
VSLFHSTNTPVLRDITGVKEGRKEEEEEEARVSS